MTCYLFCHNNTAKKLLSSCYRWEKLILSNLLKAAGPKTGRISIWEEASRSQIDVLLTKFLHFVCAQSCLTLCDPLGYGPPGSSSHRIFLARILEWVAISSSRESSWPRDRTCFSCVSCIGRQVLYHWATWEFHQGISWGSSSTHRTILILSCYITKVQCWWKHKFESRLYYIHSISIPLSVLA